jgi:hypothetical protein
MGRRVVEGDSRMRILDLESTLLLMAAGCTTGRVAAASAGNAGEPGCVYALRDESELWTTGEIVRRAGDITGPLPGEPATPIAVLPKGTQVTVEGVEFRWAHVRHLTPVGRWNRVEQVLVSFPDPRDPACRLTGRLLFSDLLPDTAATAVRAAA